jgi:hypothetical protein
VFIAETVADAVAVAIAIAGREVGIGHGAV